MIIVRDRKAVVKRVQDFVRKRLQAFVELDETLCEAENDEDAEGPTLLERKMMGDSSEMDDIDEKIKANYLKFVLR
jgi:hypothetical protein